MQTKTKATIGLSLVLLLGALLVVGIPALAKSEARPEPQPMAPTAPANAVSVDLCAKAGSLTLPDSTMVDVWGFALKPDGVPCTDASVEAQVPGPMLEFTAGDAVSITLHNALTENVSLAFRGQALMPDGVGAAPGGSVTYAFTVGDPGTYLYESGTMTGTTASIQVAMGLYGAMIVRPAVPGHAYGRADTAYDTEAVLVLGEIDPALNADPMNFNFLDYAPKYWLINGKAYPETETLPGKPGGRLLIRYLNASLSHHTMTVLGMHQRVIAMDGYPLNHPYDAVAVIIPAGQTWDTIATVPGQADLGDTLALYSRNLNVTNQADFPGGMMTFVEVGPWQIYMPIVYEAF